MHLKDFIPFNQGPAKTKKIVLTSDDKKSLAKAFKVAALSLGADDNSIFSTQRTKFQESPYDFDTIIQAIDTDSYARQAISKYKELFWKEGWTIVGENPDAVDYLWRRIDFMEIAMSRPFQEFLTEVIDQLVKFHNVFIVKSRGNLAPYFPGRLRVESDQLPVVGYYVLPTEKIEIYCDKHNKPKKYRQKIDSVYTPMGDQPRQPEWKPEDVIHLHLDRKPGRAFGTPFLISSLDDVRSLRQIEQDILNLIHRELFPLYVVKIGTEDHPAEQEEVENAQADIAAMRVDGAMIVPHRFDIDVMGADGNVFDASKYVTHFKERVAMGLGVYPHHLGMSSSGMSQDATDRLDSALYDRIKFYQKSIEEAVRFFMINELLVEGGFNPFDSPELDGASDRCYLRFNEIDNDTKIKKEAHIINKVTSNLVNIPEGRTELGLTPEISEPDTMAALQMRMTPDTLTQGKKADGSPGKPQVIDLTPQAAQKDGNQAPSKGGKPNPRNLRKGAANVIRPQNQFGRRTSPNIRHDSYDENWLQEVEDLLNDEV